MLGTVGLVAHICASWVRARCDIDLFYFNWFGVWNFGHGASYTIWHKWHSRVIISPHWSSFIYLIKAYYRRLYQSRPWQYIEHNLPMTKFSNVYISLPTVDFSVIHDCRIQIFDILLYYTGGYLKIGITARTGRHYHAKIKEQLIVEFRNTR